MINYVDNIINIREYSNLYRAVNRKELDDIIIKNALEKTLFSISAYDYGEIVGYGRIVGDESLFVYIEDVMVHPDYKDQKIEDEIIYMLLDKIKEYKETSPELKVLINSNYNNEQFYRKFGFITRKEARLGSGMILSEEIANETKIYNWEEEISEEELLDVITTIENDGIVIFPTDTVYDIACNCYCERAIDKLYEVKQKAKYKPMTILTDSAEEIFKIVSKVTQKEKELIKKYMPGPLTIVFDKKEGVPNNLTAGLDTIGIRIPNSKIALTILKNLPYPLAITSANMSGKKDGVEISDFINDFDGKVDIIIDGGKTKLQNPSTIVRVENDNIEIIREGNIKL